MKNTLINHILNNLPKGFEYDYESSETIYVRNTETDDIFAINVFKILGEVIDE